MSPRLRHLGFAFIAGFALAFLTKFIYDLFNGYSAVQNYLIREGIRLSAVEINVIEVVAMVIPAIIVGRVLLSRLFGAPAKVVLACAIPWVALNLYGYGAGLIGADGQLLWQVMSSSLHAMLAPILTILSVPIGLWLAVKSKHRGRSIAL